MGSPSSLRSPVSPVEDKPRARNIPSPSILTAPVATKPTRNLEERLRLENPISPSNAANGVGNGPLKMRGGKRSDQDSPLLKSMLQNNEVELNVSY
jgi:hypothetical protein